MSQSVQRKYDLYSQAAMANPFPTFAKMRRDDPIFRQPGLDGKTMIWFVSRYEDVATILRNDTIFVRDQRNVLPPEKWWAPDPTEALLNEHMLNRDGDAHRRLRLLVTKAFTPRMVRQMEPRIQAVADQLIDRVYAQGKMDLAAEFSFHLPTIVLAEMLGIPDHDLEKFKVWSNATLQPPRSQAEAVEMQQHIREFVTYLQTLIGFKRDHPADDLLTGLIQAEEAGDKLQGHELISMVMLLIVAGHETTVNLINNAVLALCAFPDQMALLKADPSLMPQAVEEFLRYEGSVERVFSRWAAQDFELDGNLIRKGELVVCLIGSANRDESQFEQADVLNVERAGSRDHSRHMGFGHGVHYCVGAPLARMETAIALNSLLQRLPNLQTAVPREELQWRMLPGFRSVEALPIVWDTKA
ncbi:MAG: cytochrome P450 [Chloroflexota bacterium]